MLFDTHAHLNDKRFDEDRDALIASFAENGVGACCEIGYDIKSSKKAVDLAGRYEFIYAACGVHPHDTDELTLADMDDLRELIKADKCVALGEIGLDYYYDNSLRENQRRWFDSQMDIADECGIPVTIHTRDAMKDTIDILKCHTGSSGIIHCYSGSVESAKLLLDMGYFISFAGPVTFKNATTALDVIRYVPTDRMLIETDSPYLAPVPYRGKRNCPVYVSEVAGKIAEIKGMTFDEVASVTFENAKKAYRIK